MILIRDAAKNSISVVSIPTIQTEYWSADENCESFVKICHIDQMTNAAVNTLTVTSKSETRLWEVCESNVFVPTERCGDQPLNKKRDITESHIP